MSSKTPTSPELSVENASGTGRTAFPGPYVDQARTVRKPPPQTLVPDPPPSGSTTLGDVRPVYANDAATEIANTAANPGVAPQPRAGNSWQVETTADGIQRSRDPYRNNGMVGQRYLQNPPA